MQGHGDLSSIVGRAGRRQPDTLPGVGKKRAGAIAAARPFRDLAAFRAVAGGNPLEGALSFREG